jgi:hypothetical protein
MDEYRDRVQRAMIALSMVLGLSGSSSRFVVFATSAPTTGFHVLWPNVIVNKERFSSAHLDTVMEKATQCLTGQNLNNLKVDRGCLQNGNLRLPFQSHPTKLGNKKLFEYSSFFAPDPPSTIRSAIIAGSILLTSQARNPTRLHETIRGVSAPLPTPQHRASDEDAIWVDVDEGTNQVGSPPAAALPPFLLEMLQKNGGTNLASILKRYEYGTDFTQKKALPVLSVQLLAEIGETLRKNALFSWTPEDIEVEIVCVMNNHFAHVGSNLIVHRCWGVSNDSVVLGTMTVADFVTKFQSLNWKSSVEIETKTGQMVKRWKKFAISKLWLEHPARRCYQSYVYTPYPASHPKGHKPDQINMYRGWRWSPEELQLARASAGYTQRKAAEAFQKHIFNIICAGDLEKFQFFMCFLAKKIRCPWCRPDSTFVITGPEGVGKSMLFERLLVFAADNGAKCTDINELFGTFNVQYRHKTIIFIDEGSWAGAVSANTKLKNFITSDEVRTEQKYRDGEKAPNFSCVFVVSNSRVVMVQGENARRYLFYTTANTVSRGRQAAHYDYFESLCKLDDDDYHGLKLWLSQFYDERLYEDRRLNQYGRFNSPFFPTACMREMERQKCFSHASVTKFWERVLNRHYTYPPYLDFNLNSTDRKDHLFEYREDKTAVVYNDGRTFADLVNPHPDLDKCNLKTLLEVMSKVRNPTWNHERHWLATMNVKQLYHAYLDMRKIDLVPRKGMEENVDLSSFLFTTKMIFREIIEKSETPCEFVYTVKAEWQSRSNARVTVPNDSDWLSNEQRSTARGTFVGQPMTMLSLGSWDDCARAFYNFTGLDVTPDKIHQSKDVQSRPNLYDRDWAQSCLAFFDQ